MRTFAIIVMTVLCTLLFVQAAGDGKVDKAMSKAAAATEQGVAELKAFIKKM